MGPWVAALSAGASDMSAWVLMGLPTSIYALGLGQVWISVGLAIGYTISWLYQAPRLRKFSIAANDSITIPQYLTNRFLSKSNVLQILCAVVFLVAYTIYAASSIKACGTLFNTVIGMDSTLAMYLAAVIGIVGRMFVGYDENVNANSLVFIEMVRRIFPSIISGILLSAVLAASMSTADSQLLSAASAFASDVYKPVFRKNRASDREMLWAGRMVVLVIAVLALLLASNPNAGSIMDLVSNAWGVFGAAFGPVIMLSLFWKRFNFKGAVAGILAGALVDMGWLAFLSSTGIYKIIPGFAAGLLAAVAVSLLTEEPSKDVEELFDKAVNYEE